MSIFSKYKKTINHRLINLLGYTSKEPLLVIESDDWGSIRMPSMDVYNDFVKAGYDLTKSDYNRLDTLESNEDLEALYEVLSKYKDTEGNHPVVTANCIVGNPDFETIKASDFEEYHYESVLKTLSRYPGRDKVYALWKDGNEKRMFRPQFHGREHVNIVRWMSSLREKTPEIMYTFDKQTTFSGKGDYSFMEVLDYNSPKDLGLMKESLVDGLNLFEELFGYRSGTFIPPCYAWDSNIEQTLYENGVKYIQGLFVQCVPTGTFEQYKKKYHFMGSKNKLGQFYLMRNSFFEPSLSKAIDPVGDCLNRIDLAFKYRKPAIISSHRINFIGSLNEKNRTDNLLLLDDLLSRVLKKWPSVKFLSSDQLGDIISGTNK